MGIVDVSNAYMTSGPIKRSIYVRPPGEWDKGTRWSVWELRKMPYGITDAGRQWATVIESWLTGTVGMETMKGVSQFFMKRRSDHSLAGIVTKVTDHLLFAGSIDDMNNFVTEIKKRFQIGKLIIDDDMLFNGCRINPNEHGMVEMSMETYMESLKPLEITRERRRQGSDKVSPQEYHTVERTLCRTLASFWIQPWIYNCYDNSCRSISGSMIWAGNGEVPYASYVGSYFQQTAPQLRLSEHT